MIELIYVILNILVMLIFTLGMYFLPSIIATTHRHKNIIPIILLNIILGWTFIGWIIAFIWAISNKE